MLLVVQFASKHFDITLNVTSIFCDVSESCVRSHCNGYDIIHLLRKCYTERTGVALNIPQGRPVNLQRTERKCKFEFC
jgi:hypothetical protein